VFFAVPTPGHTPEELRDAIRADVEKLKKEDITDDELNMIKTRAKADLLRTLDSNAGLAEQLATAQALFGDWRYFFQEANRIDQVTKAEIREAANQTFLDSNRVVGRIETAQAAHQMAGGKETR